MTEENSTSRENLREVGTFVKKFFEDAYQTEKGESLERIKSNNETIALLKPWWDSAGKDRMSTKGSYYLSLLDANAQEGRYTYLLSMTCVLAEAFEIMTRTVTTEDKKELSKHLEELMKKADEGKQKLDEHIAKRLGELLGKGGEGYIG